LVVTAENLTAASSVIKDVDVAEESTQYARTNILVQSGTAMLAQANQVPQTVLRLLQ
jgi:flagellin